MTTTPPPGHADPETDPDTGADADVTVATDPGPNADADTDGRPRIGGVAVPHFPWRLSTPGVAVAALFFAYSLYPSLLPRSGPVQGVLSGITLMIGYALGVTAAWLWRYLQIPRHRRVELVAWIVVTLFLIGTTVAAIWRQVGWQNDVRALFGMDPVSPWHWVITAAVAAGVAAALLLCGRAVGWLLRLLARWLNKIMPPRLAMVGGIAVIVVVTSTVVSGALVDGFFAGANAIFSANDRTTEPGVSRPDSTLRSGGPESLADWDDLGRTGRRFVAQGPTVEELAEVHGPGVIEPIRVYAGLKSAGSVEGRADLVLAELQRTGAFDRSVLVVATTTGTGFLDAPAIDALEYLHGGDTAVVGVQYSYLPSWISLLADQEAVQETSQAVFSAIHSYWSALPEDSRPELYLYGLSLGSYGVESVLNSIEIVNSPIDGALMSGPPFVNPMHSRLIAERAPGSPPFQPVIGDGATVRFRNLETGFDTPAGPWGPTRIAYLQHNSDSITFFSPRLAFSSPDWLREGQRAPDVSEKMVWRPVITMWQVAADLVAAGDVPRGHGHNFSARENLDAWVAITRPEDWTPELTERIVAALDPDDQG